jgi:hypothetical protein
MSSTLRLEAGARKLELRPYAERRTWSLFESTGERAPADLHFRDLSRASTPDGMLFIIALGRVHLAGGLYGTQRVALFDGSSTVPPGLSR